MKAITLVLVGILSLTSMSCSKDDLVEDEILIESLVTGGTDGEVKEKPGDD